MILHQNSVTNYWTESTDTQLIHVHNPANCEGRGCAVHNHPSDHPLKDAELNWREDRNILERICSHGIGHPDYDSAQYLISIGQEYQNVHGCDGCCGGI